MIKKIEPILVHDEVALAVPSMWESGSREDDMDLCGLRRTNMLQLDILKGSHHKSRDVCPNRTIQFWAQQTAENGVKDQKLPIWFACLAS